ncbi:MAG: cyclopropane-fatty-acyl-phospholipid synthase family protein [Pseudomonadota bacterium]
MNRLLAGIFNKMLSDGLLVVYDHKNARHEFGAGQGNGAAPQKTATIRFHTAKSQWAIVRDPILGAAESYMDGSLTLENADGSEGEIIDMLDLFTWNLKWHPDNAVRMALANKPRLFTALEQLNARRAAKRNVAHHYDLSGKLYDLFLDKDRQYSCAYFRDNVDDLERAQQDKKAHIAAKLLLKSEQRGLDIGCGWGGMALYLNEISGIDMTGVTLSEEQLGIARQRAQDRGVSDQVRFSLTDYRDVDDRFDRIVSVGMFEHVGRPNFAEFFNKSCQLLKDDGVMLLHTIGRADGPGVTDSFTRKYIFPGGYTPALSEVMPHIEKAGLYVTDIEILRLHYSKTLKYWYDRCKAARQDITTLYDERFYRMWQFYLAASRCAFDYGGHVNFQIQLARQVDTVPLTRDYMGHAEREMLG